MNGDTNMITEKDVINYINEHANLTTIRNEMPDEYFDCIHSLLEIPFPMEGEKDRELVLYLYLIYLMKYYILDETCIEGQAIDALTFLVELLETVYDDKPEYRVERFYAA